MKRGKNENQDISGIIPYTNQNYNETISGIDNTYNEISGYLNEGKLSNEKMEYLKQKVALDKLAKNIDRDIEYSKINLNKEVTDFLNQYESYSTRKVYFFGINNYLKFCNNDSTEYLKTNSKKVQLYIHYLSELVSPATVHSYIKSNSSFFQYLHREYYDTIRVNPFSKQKVPRLIGKFKKDFLKPHDFPALCNYLKSINKLKYLILIKFLYKTGHRVGIINKMKIQKDGTWSSISKGKPYKGKLSKTEYNNFIKQGVLNINTKSASSIIKKYTTRLFNKGEISCTFSLHDIRRDKILREIKKNKDGAESLLKTSKKFHGNINTTIGYINEFYD